MEFISFKSEVGIAYITLKNEKEYNALSLKLLTELDSLLREIATKREARVIILRVLKRSSALATIYMKWKEELNMKC